MSLPETDNHMQPPALNIRDVGPIANLSIQVQPEGGVVVLKGRNGSGKTTALRGAEALVRGEGKLQTRDGSPSSGRVEGFGAMLALGRKATRAGEVEVSSLEGKLNIADLVSPPLKDPGAADRQRIKALVSLAGTGPSQELFRDVIGDAADAISAATWAGNDLLDVAAKAKRDLEAEARLQENAASAKEGQAKACEQNAADVDLEAEADEKVLRERYAEASSELTVLSERARAAKESAARVEMARRQLAQLDAEDSGPSVAEADERLSVATSQEHEAEQAVRDLERRLDAAKADLARKQDARGAAQHARDAAAQREKARATYQQILDGSVTDPPDPALLEAAQQAVNDASAAIEQGALIRRARAQLKEAQQHRADANTAAARAEQLRTAASQIDDVLSRAITSDRLFVRDGRLYTTTEARGETLFGELSDGERWELAFDIAAPIVGERGLLVLPQDAWQHLDPESRGHVAKLARERSINVLTAEATDGELRAESFDAEGGADA